MYVTDVRPDLPGLVDHHPRAAGMLVAVPAAGQIAGREDHARAAAEIDPFQARRSVNVVPSPFLYVRLPSL